MSNTTRLSDELLSQPYNNICNHLKKCESLKRIHYILTQYHNINKDNQTLSSTKNKLIIQTLHKYDHLINDYHHIITKHLSHSNQSRNTQNLSYIHSQIIECDIHQCQQFIAHYKCNYIHTRHRLHSFYLHYLRGIHIHFVHALNAGFRSYITPNILDSHPQNTLFDQDLINQLLLFNFGDRDDIINAMVIATNKHDVNQIIDILKKIKQQKHQNLISMLSSSEFYQDDQMIAIKHQIQTKRALIRTNNKFSTNISTSAKTSITDPRRTSTKINKLILNHHHQYHQKIHNDNDENTKDTFSVLLMKNLAQNGINSHILDEFNEWRMNNNYDSDGIIDDIVIAIKRGHNESNIHHYCRLKNQIKCFQKIKQYVVANAKSLVGDNIAAEKNVMIKAGNEEKVNNVKRGSREYVFGQRFFYWRSHENEKWYLDPKYRSFKEEMLNLISLKLYNVCCVKAVELNNESAVLKAIRSNKDGQKLGYDIAPHLPLSVSNILSIIFYTDCHVLSNAFKSTFYKLSFDETDIAQKQRHSVYWHWSKVLTQTIECYGTPFWFNKIDKVYHNTTFMYYSLFTATFNAPTSMTRYIEVAAMYCQENGIILEMSQYPKIRANYFDCSLISAHGIEDELLFIGGDKSMDITSIRIMSRNQDHQSFIKAMRLFDKVTRATILSKLERCEITESDYIIIQRLIKNNNNFPEYTNESFRRFCSDKKRIKMDCFCLRDNRYYHQYGSLFMHQYHLNLLQFDYICKLFPNALSIESWDTGQLTSLYLTALRNILIVINKMGDAVKLNKIIIHCDPFDVQCFNPKKHRFTHNNWIIRLKEPWELLLLKVL